MLASLLKHEICILEKLFSWRRWALCCTSHALGLSEGNSLRYSPIPPGFRRREQPISWIPLPGFASSRTQLRAHQAEQNSGNWWRMDWAALTSPSPLPVAMETPASGSQAIRKYLDSTIYTQVLRESIGSPKRSFNRWRIRGKGWEDGELEAQVQLGGLCPWLQRHLFFPLSIVSFRSMLAPTSTLYLFFSAHFFFALLLHLQITSKWAARYMCKMHWRTQSLETPSTTLESR